MAEAVAPLLGQSVVVENRGGAGGVLGVEAMSHAPPDGYTLSLTGAGTLTAGPALRRLPYDPMTLANVTRLITAPFIIAAANDFAARDIAGLIALGKQREIRYASGGIGTSQHLAGALFEQMTGLRMTHVPYRGTGPALNDLAAGIVDIYFGDPATLSLIQGGQARALGVTSEGRWPPLPDTPAVAETVPGYAPQNWYGLAAPPGTPAPIVAFLHARIAEALGRPAVAAKFDRAGLHPAPLAPAEYAEFLRRDAAAYAEVIRRGNIRLDSD
nr:tripartite tricarboxylate transporter substrate binding protein [Roseomonas acroporae]